MSERTAGLTRCEERLEETLAERDNLERRLQLAWLRHRPEERTAGHYAVSGECSGIVDGALVRRIISAYGEAIKIERDDLDSFWSTQFAEVKRPIHEALLRGNSNEIAGILRNPSRSMLFYGFDNLNAEGVHTGENWWPVWQSQLTYDNLLRLTEALGERRLYNPESPSETKPPPDSEALLIDLDRVLGFRVEFPNPFAGELGLATSRGVASYRAIQALYQAWRITRIAGDCSQCRVLEIGAGLGRTAYYARKMGIDNYMLIDIPMTGVSQAYFLGRLAGTETIELLDDENREERPIRIFPPRRFFDSGERFDLVVNVDSLTEMGLDVARQYWREIEQRASVFLSINHEANRFTVRDLYLGDPAYAVARFPYWMRRGYVEEVVELS